MFTHRLKATTLYNVGGKYLTICSSKEALCIGGVLACLLTEPTSAECTFSHGPSPHNLWSELCF